MTRDLCDLVTTLIPRDSDCEDRTIRHQPFQRTDINIEGFGQYASVIFISSWIRELKNTLQSAIMLIYENVGEGMTPGPGLLRLSTHRAVLSWDAMTLRLVSILQQKFRKKIADICKLPKSAYHARTQVIASSLRWFHMRLLLNSSARRCCDNRYRYRCLLQPSRKLFLRSWLILLTWTRPCTPTCDSNSNPPRVWARHRYIIERDRGGEFTPNAQPTQNSYQHVPTYTHSNRCRFKGSGIHFCTYNSASTRQRGASQFAVLLYYFFLFPRDAGVSQSYGQGTAKGSYLIWCRNH